MVGRYYEHFHHDKKRKKKKVKLNLKYETMILDRKSNII